MRRLLYGSGAPPTVLIGGLWSSCRGDHPIDQIGGCRWLANSTVACDVSRGTPARRSDRDNFDTAQMIDVHRWVAELIAEVDPGALVNSGMRSHVLPRFGQGK